MPDLSRNEISTSVVECKDDSCKTELENKRLKTLLKDVLNSFYDSIGCIPDYETRARWYEDIREYRYKV